MEIATLAGRCLLAPMAGITDAAFRQQCKTYGAALVVTELTSVEGIVRKNEQLADVLDVRPGEFPVIQLFGNDIDTIVKAAKIVEPLACAIDFNIGCPAPHITAQEAGAALLMQSEHLKKIIASLKSAVKLPITAKIRLGPSDRNLVYKEVALALQEAGVDMITVHPRTVKQGYSGKADWEKIRELVELLDIPVCGNGDIKTPEDAKRMFEQTGCHCVMIGRAAAGNPFIFKQCEEYFRAGRYAEPTQGERAQAFADYVDLAQSYGIRLSRIKSMAMQCSRGLDAAREKRLAIARAQTIKELKAVF